MILSFISLIIFFSKMGITSSENEIQEQRNANSQYYSSHPTPTFISSAAAQYRLLSEFRDILSFRECLYTFATLLQQYSEKIKKRQGIVISDEHCKVSPFGEIIVTPVINNSQEQAQNKYSQMMQKLFELVNKLSIQSEWAKNRSVVKLKQRAKMLTSLFDNQQQLFNNIFQQFSQFLQEAKSHSNLIGALCRINQHAKRRSALQDSFKFNSKRRSSFASISLLSSSFIDVEKTQSNKNRQKERKSIFSHYHKQAQYQNSKSSSQLSSQKQSYYENIRFQDSFQSQSLPKTGFKKNKRSNRYYISPQFSINVFLKKPHSNIRTNQILKARRDRYQTQTLGSSCHSQSDDNEIIKLPKNKTSSELHGRKAFKHHKINEHLPKSVLDTMARLFQVKELSSSKSYIH